MLILIYTFLKSLVVNIASAIFEPLMIIFGISLMLGAIGVKCSTNVGTTVVGKILDGIGFLAKTLLAALGWILKNSIRLTPKMHLFITDFFLQRGLNAVVSNIISIIAIIILWLIII